MSLFVLDTDHLTLFRRGHPALVAKATAVATTAQITITLVTVEEQLTGWYTQLRKSRDPTKLAQAYQGLLDVVDSIKAFAVLPFSLSAVQRYVALRKQFRRLGHNDLAIAAIVLEHHATLVTRNTSDFQQIPGLALADWTLP